MYLEEMMIGRQVPRFERKGAHAPGYQKTRHARLGGCHVHVVHKRVHIVNTNEINKTSKRRAHRAQNVHIVHALFRLKGREAKPCFR